MRLRICAALIAVTCFEVHAQISTAALSGVVVDPQDSVVPSVTVTLFDPARGAERKAVTNEAGAFIFPQIPPSTYEIAVDHSGFQKSRLTGVILNADDQRSVRVRLAVAKRDDTVVVTDEAPLVRESPAVATSVDRKFIENQPLNGRSFQSLIQLAPGVVVTPASLVSQGQFRSTANDRDRMRSVSMVSAPTSVCQRPLLLMKVLEGVCPRSLRKAVRVHLPRLTQCRSSRFRPPLMRPSMAVSRGRRLPSSLAPGPT